MSSEPIDRMVSALESHGCAPQRAGSGWRARCPAHEDKRASLSVSGGNNGGCVVHCHAGCSVESVVAALGLGLADLMPDNGKAGTPNSRPGPKPAAGNGRSYPTAEAAIGALAKQFGGRPPDHRWDYHDATGNVVGVVLRWNRPDGDKDIRPVRRNPDGTWAIGAMPEPRPLYRLPEVLAAAPDVPVVVVEGEKAADAAVACGLVATTSSGGAKAASKTDWKPLAGRRVVVLPDNDEAGEQYAEDVARLCVAAGVKDVRILRLADYAPGLPAGGDLADMAALPTWCGLPVGEGAGPADAGRWILGTAETIEPWRPEPAGEPLAWQPYPTETLPEPFRRFAEVTARACVCDASYVALPLVIAAAAAIGTTRVLQLKPGWRAPSILWGAIVGESGTLKTPALWAALQWAERRQAECLAAHDAARAQFDADRLIYEKAVAEWKRSKAGGLPPIKPVAPVATRMLVQDTTVEALAPILKANPRGVLLARDELAGWLTGFDRYVNTRGADVAHWLSMYNAKGIIVDRKTSGTIYVPVAAVSIVGGIQPGVLQRALGLANRENGLAARLLLVMPPAKAKRWTTAHVEPALVESVGQVFDALFALEHDIGDDGKPVARVLRLSPDAQAAYIAFYNAHAVELADAVGDMAAALSKLEELPARLALVFHLVRWAAGEAVNPDVVDAASMTRAIALTEWHKHETRRVYDALDAANAEERRLVEWIERRGGAVTARDLTHGLRQFRGKPDAAEAALAGLVQAGVGVWEDVPADKKGGRPKRVFRLCHQCHRHRNLRILGDFWGFGDGDSGDEPTTTPPEPQAANLMPPKGGLDVDAINRLFDEASYVD